MKTATYTLNATDIAMLNELMQNGIKKDATICCTFYTGYAYDTLYDWDQYFEAIMQLEMGWTTEYIINGLLLFLEQMEENGFTARSRAVEAHCLADERYEMAKPFLAQIALLVSRDKGNCDWLSSHHYSAIKMFIKWWIEGLSKDGGELSYWRSGPHTGMDTQHERAGYWQDDICVGVDLNAYIYRECIAAELLANACGDTDAVQYFQKMANHKKENIQKKMWNEEKGFFYDIDARTGEQMDIMSAAGFMPLWAGIASKEQTRRVIEEHLLNPKEFWRPFPVPAYAATEKGYREERVDSIDLGCLWRAHTWIPVNYIVMHILSANGYIDKAHELAEITARKVREIGIYEYYTSESCAGCGLHPFWGWTTLAYVMPWETANGNDPTELTLDKGIAKICE